MIYENIHKSWEDFLTKDIKLMLEDIESKLGKNYVPIEKNILRFLETDLNNVKCIWLGQDPYYTLYKDKYGNEEPVANGRSFQPDLLNNWNDSFTQVSLKNIIRLIYKNYNNIELYDDVKTFSKIREEINIGKFNILQPKDWFDSLENQGVLFLNTYLTTIPGKPNAHKNIWKEFSKKILKYILEKNSEAIWFLWGKESYKIKEDIDINKNKVYFSNHPTFCSKKYDNDFLKGNCFKDTMNIINWLG